MSSDVWRRAASSKFPRLSQNLLPWWLTERTMQYKRDSSHFLGNVYYVCFCWRLLLGRSADVRELCNRLAGVPPLQREGESNLAREKEDPEAEMNRTTARHNGSYSSNTVIYFQVCLQLIISLREEITKFGDWQLWVKSSRQTYVKEFICKSKHKYLLVESYQRRMNLVRPRSLALRSIYSYFYKQ